MAAGTLDQLVLLGLPPPQQTEKKVHFAPFSEIYRDIPWSHRPAQPIESDFTRNFDNTDLSPLDADLRESVYALRTEIRGDEAMTMTGLIILVIFLLVLFLMIWFVVRKVLLLEVDTEIDRQGSRRPLKFR
jgi:hypothetical protein